MNPKARSPVWGEPLLHPVCLLSMAVWWLNDHLGKNFYDYVNEQRIAHARKLLVERPELPVVDVAIACGYNNKNSFYNSFRRFVGVTPTEFRQQSGKSPLVNR